MHRVHALLLAAPLLACAGEREAQADTAAREPAAASSVFDGSPERVIEALREGDTATLRSYCSQALAAELDDEEIALLGAAIEALGDLRSAERVREDPLAGGGQRHNYLLRFAAGDADLELEQDVGGRLAAFRVSGPDLERALTDARNAAPHPLEVVELSFRGPAGEAVAADALVGRHVEYDLTISGLDAVAGSFHLSVAARVRDARGKELYGRPIVFDTRFGASPDGRPVGTVHGSFELPAPGAHELTLEITDENGRAVITHRAQLVAREKP